MKTTYTTISNKKTHQNQPIIGRTDQVQNNAGGYVFKLNDWQQLERFLILGSEGGTYYAAEQKLTLDNANVVLRCIKENGEETVERITEISLAGRAAKQDPAIFALAICASMGDIRTKQKALSDLPAVCRTGTALFHFMQYAQQFRGWGRGLRKGVANWYTNKPRLALELQLVKYQSRDGWTHKDALILAHPKSDKYNDVFNWVMTGEYEGTDGFIYGFEKAKVANTVEEVVDAITKYNLPRECVPTKWLNERKVWEALLPTMPMTALIRNLNKLTQVGILDGFSDDTIRVIAKIANEENLASARIHPYNILVAQRTYAMGRGVKGHNTWTPVPRIVDALNDAFYLAFGAVTPTNKRTMLALDVSCSMGWTYIGDIISCRDAAAAMSLVTARVEPKYIIVGFTGGEAGISRLNISAGDRLDSAINKITNLRFGSTDCALPMLYALKHKLEVDTFVIYTDNETWAGNIHPTQALDQYRKESGIQSKLIVVGMTATQFSIADPNDFNSLDVIGFDSAAPQLIAEFSSGNI